MARRFQTAGPCRAGACYMIPAVSRLPEVPDLVECDRAGHRPVGAG